MVGEDFRCGYKGYFCVSEIQEFCEKKSLTLQVCIDVILEDATIYSYACRTGLGNSKIDKEANDMNPMTENSIAQALANATGATVYAYFRRTDYSNTLLNEKERIIVENKYSKLTEEEKVEYKHLYEIWMTNKYEVEGEILYPKGARYPINAADTPKGVPLSMIMYRDKT